MTFKRIKFVTDSTCDLSPEVVEKYDIQVAPCYINYGGESYADDGVELDRDEYYSKLGSMPDHPTTAAMPPDVAKEHIQRAWQDADHVVIVTAPKELSAIYNAMRIGAQDFPQDSITLIDSEQLSLGLGWQVQAGAEAAAETGDLDAVLAEIERVRRDVWVYAVLGSLESLRRSGRINWAAAGVGSLLQVKPVIRVKYGRIDSAARIRTFSRAVEKLVEFSHEQAPLERAAILHVANPEAVEPLREQLAGILPDDVLIGTITPTLGTHLGPGTIGVGLLHKESPA
jgi:DegV family protein with EDD domain